MVLVQLIPSLAVYTVFQIRIHLSGFMNVLIILVILASHTGP